MMLVAEVVTPPVDGYGEVTVRGERRRAYFDPTRLSGSWATGTRALVSVQPTGVVVLWVLS